MPEQTGRETDRFFDATITSNYLQTVDEEVFPLQFQEKTTQNRWNHETALLCKAITICRVELRKKSHRKTKK